MTLVDKYEKFTTGKIVKEGKRWFAGAAPVEVAAVVFNAAAITYLAYHLYIERRSLFQSLCLERFARVTEGLYFVVHVALYHGKRVLELIGADSIVTGGEYAHMLEF